MLFGNQRRKKVYLGISDNFFGEYRLKTAKDWREEESKIR